MVRVNGRRVEKLWNSTPTFAGFSNPKLFGVTLFPRFLVFDGLLFAPFLWHLA